MKRKVTAIVEKGSDGGYSCYVAEDLDGFGLSGYGNTAEEAIDDMNLVINEMTELRLSEGLSTDTFDITYQYDIESFFNYFSFLNISKIGELANINPSLLRQYASGRIKPGKKQYEKLKKAVNHIATQMAIATF